VLIGDLDDVRGVDVLPKRDKFVKNLSRNRQPGPMVEAFGRQQRSVRTYSSDEGRLD